MESDQLRRKYLKDANDLASEINENEAIFQLASCPLNLMIILLVFRNSNSLPNDRLQLYEKSIQVLIETWNDAKLKETQNDAERKRIDSQKAKREKIRLAYISYIMCVKKTLSLSKYELKEVYCSPFVRPKIAGL